MRKLIPLLVLVLFAAAPAFARDMISAGGEKLVLVKKQSQSFYVPGADGTWAVEVSGPSQVALGFRLLSKNGRAAAALKATLDGVVTSAIDIKPRREPAAKLAGTKRAKVSREVVVRFDVPEGRHVLQLRVEGVQVEAIARLLDAVPAGALAAPAFPAPAEMVVAQPPPSAPPPAVPTAAADATQPLTPPPVPPAETGGVEVIMAAAAAGAERAPEVTADTLPRTAAGAPPLGLTLGIAAGVGFPQLLSKLSTAVSAVLEAGYRLPAAQQRFEVHATGSYHQATRRASDNDSRLVAGDSYDFTLIERQILVTLGALVRLYPPASPFNVYGHLGGRLELQRSQAKGDVESLGFGENTETRTSGGFLVGAGVELLLGPGVIAAELDFALGDLSHRVTGDTSSGGLGLNVGYRLLL